MADQNAAAERRTAAPAIATAAATLLALLQPCVGSAASERLSADEIDLTADLVTSDQRKDIHELSGNVRISQGEMSMEADKATANAMQTDHAHWTFDRSVRIKTADANLTSDSASATFVNGQIAAAIAKGTPATFEQRNSTADKRVRGRANNIEYDFGKGTVKLTDNVWFSQGGNEFRGDTLIYYVREERVVMNPGGKEPGRVNITIRPRSSGANKPAKETPGAAAKDKNESGA
jgi:lipopolysaccharide transport protein LptA